MTQAASATDFQLCRRKAWTQEVCDFFHKLSKFSIPVFTSALAQSKTTAFPMMNGLTENRQKAIACLILFVGTLLLFLPSLQNEFLNYDDDQYITENELVKAGPSWRALSEPHFFMWHPVTTLSHQIDYSLFGMNPAGHRLGNIIIHGVSAVLVLLLVWRATGILGAATITAALFAWHPLRVESVVWAAERKDVLCTCFWLMTLHAYLTWQKNQTRANHLLTLAGCALAMMSKPMAATLPLTLILLDYWPLQRILRPAADEWQHELHQRIREKIPFFLMASLITLITITYQSKTETIVSLDEVGLAERLINIPAAYGMYLLKLFIPTNLAVFYPPQPEIPVFGAIVSLLTLALAGRFAWQRKATEPHLLFGLIWFLVILLPVIGLLQSGRQSMADRYSYLPSLGIILAVVLGALKLAKKPAAQKMVYFISALAIVGCLFLTHRQIPHWQNSETLFRHALAVTENNYIAHINLGAVLADSNRLDEALTEYEAALAIRPSVSLHFKLGQALLATAKPALAEKQFRQIISMEPEDAEAHFALAMALTDQERMDEAAEHLEKALSLQPTLMQRVVIPPRRQNQPDGHPKGNPQLNKQ
jgi:tetratricopeptide (TPR) repeat protein